MSADIIRNLFEVFEYEGIHGVRNAIKLCQDIKHVQQVAYSTYHDCLTQVCFTCKTIRTSGHLLKEAGQE